MIAAVSSSRSSAQPAATRLAMLALLTIGIGLLPAARVPAADFNPRASTDGSDPAGWDPKLDSLIAAPGNHQLLYENAKIRVIRVTVPAGTTEPLHMHRYCSVLVFDNVPAKLKDLDAKGAESQRSVPPYNAITNPLVAVQQPNAPHSIVNSDSTPVQLVRIEFKDEKGPCNWDSPILDANKSLGLTTLKEEGVQPTDRPAAGSPR